MGTGWRKVFCTATECDTDSSTPHETPASRKFDLFRTSRSCPSTPRQREATSPEPPKTPVLRCRTRRPAGMTASAITVKAGHEDKVYAAATSAQASMPRSSRLGFKLLSSISINPPSPRSPSNLAQLLKNNFRSTRGKCGVCLQSVKAAKGTSIFAAECSHTFHLQCLAINKQQDSCPVCAVCWQHPPLLSKFNTAGEAPKQQQCLNSLHGPKMTTPRDVQKGKTAVAVELYDDDEPLPSGHRACFYPIPEAEDGPFGGLLRVTGCPKAALLTVTHAHENHVIALKVKSVAPHKTLKVPLLDPSRRAPIDLVIVLDASGGTLVATTLQMLRQAMRIVLSCLGPHDRLAMVTASGNRRLIPLRRMTVDGQRSARRVVDKLFYEAEGATSVANATEEALTKALKVLADRRETNPVAAVMHIQLGRLPGDEFNERPEWACWSDKFIHIQVPLYSRDEVHEAAVGDVMACCVGGKLSVVCRDVRVELAFPGGTVKSVYSRTSRGPPIGRGTGGHFGLGDMHLAQEMELLAELKTDASAGGTLQRLSVRCSYRDPISEKLVQQQSEFSLPVFLGGPYQDLTPKEVEGSPLRDTFMALRAIAEARRLVQVRDFAKALHLLVSTRRLLLLSDSSRNDNAARSVELAIEELRWRQRQQGRERRAERMALNAACSNSSRAEVLTPMSAWRAAERLAKVAVSKRTLNRVRDLHGFEDARF